MRIEECLKKTTVLLAVVALAFTLNGCGGKQKTENFAVPADKLPAGVVSVVRPKPNHETLFVYGLLQESIRLNYIAQLYNKALVHYDPAKGNAKEHENLLKKTKRAWQEARDAASVAMFYAMGLSQLEREEGYDPYQKSAMLTIPEIRLMPTAYAKENRKLNTKEEVFSKYTKMDIVKDILKIPESKRLLAISKMYHTSGSTAVEIMRTVNPNYRSAESGRSLAMDITDTAYKGANVAKTAGKAAGVVIAGAAAITVAPVAVPAAVTVVAIKTADTVVDAHQTATVLSTGEEDQDLSKLLTYTETADTAASILTFDLTKPVMNMKGVGQYKFVKGATTGDKLKGYAYMNAKGLQSGLGQLAKGELRNAVGLVNAEGTMNALGVVSGVYSTVTSDSEDTNPNALVMNSREIGDGRIETRTSLIDLRSISQRESEQEKVKALALKIDEIINQDKANKEKRAYIDTLPSKELAQKAEEVANAGGANKYKEAFQNFIDGTRKGLIESILGSDANLSDLDKLLSEAAGEEMKATGIAVYQDEKGNITKATIVGEKKNAEIPFAPSRVAGTYKVPVDNKTITIIVKTQGKGIVLAYPYYRNKVLKHRTESPASYDPQTGKGTLVNEGSTCSFWFTQTNGKMSMRVGSWRKMKK